MDRKICYPHSNWDTTPVTVAAMRTAFVAKLLIKIAAGLCVGLLGGYYSYHVSCGPGGGSFWFWVREPVLRKAVIAWAVLGSAAGSLLPV
jgi:hypothetical protein